METSLEHRFRENIKKHKLIETNDTIIVGASGGPDSMALIHLLYNLKAEYKLNIILAHLNHLHRKEASYDEGLVRDLAADLGLEFRLKKASMDDLAREEKISPEDAGRRLRYGFFNEIAKDYSNAKIAVAHIMDDQAETILMRMARGTGLDGLSAMDYRSRDIIRPLLNFKKSEILEYLGKQNIAYATDATNLETDYTRNYIRHEIIPKLEYINPRAIENIFSLTELVRDDLSIIDDVIEEIYAKVQVSSGKSYVEFNRDSFESLRSAYQARLIIKAITAIENEFKDYSRENIYNFISLTELATGKKIIKDNIVFQKNYKTYILQIIETDTDKLNPKKLDLDEVINFGDYQITAIITDEIDSEDKTIAYFDYDKLVFPLEVRCRRAGDKFRPVGFDHSKKLKDYFIDNKVDRDIRDRLPVIVSDDEIIWLAPLRKANIAQVDSNTKTIVKIEVRDDL